MELCVQPRSRKWYLLIYPHLGPHLTFLIQVEFNAELLMMPKDKDVQVVWIGEWIHNFARLSSSLLLPHLPLFIRLLDCDLFRSLPFSFPRCLSPHFAIGRPTTFHNSISGIIYWLLGSTATWSVYHASNNQDHDSLVILQPIEIPQHYRMTLPSGTSWLVENRLKNKL